jgi:two-component system OmpR family response regulator/two-component system alkaline phosphatase synthesis response regulator PhoP
MAETRRLVLLVDDDVDFAKVVKLYFERSGLELISVTSGKKAIKAMDARRPDAMILDVNMPKMDGVEVCRTIRAKMGSRHLPIIALTGYHSEDRKKQMMAVGADLYLTKPIDMRKLVEHVLQVFPPDR